MNTNDIIDEIIKQIKQPLWENWYIKEKIGSGAFSAVYKVEAKRSSKRTSVAALKIEPITSDGKHFINEERKRNYIEQKKEYSENEAEIMYSLRKSPYIVAYEEEDIKELYINGVFEGYYYLIRMEYLNSITDLMMANTFDYSEANIIKVALNIGQGIKTAHDIGVIHRDIKLDNFFVDELGVYKLGDFNISKKTDATRTFAGTHGYLAPEIFKAKSNVDVNYTSQADIYSFGICLYQFMNDLLFPFEDDNCDMDTAIDRRMNGEPLPYPAHSSEEFSRIILKACENDMERRYQNMGEMLEDLSILNGDQLARKKSKANSENYSSDSNYYQGEPQAAQASVENKYISDSPDNENNGPIVIEVGNIIEFGNYYMSNSNITSPIKWRILNIQDEKALITTEYGIEGIPFDQAPGFTTWEDSSIRMWLNYDFYNIAFTDDEKYAILSAELINSDNTVYEYDNGPNTIDSIFLLSLYEANEYFKKNEDRILYPTDLAISRGVFVSDNGATWWWLRSSGNTPGYAADVDYGGDVDSYGSDRFFSINAVRPTMWISLDDYTRLRADRGEPISGSSTGFSQGKVVNNVNGYTTLEFGSYYSNKNMSRGPIVWRVLERDNNKALLITESGIDCLPFHNIPTEITWSHSDIRRWLNIDFLNMAFTNKQREAIFPVRLFTPNNAVYYTNGGEKTQDCVFLLSLEEANRYFRSNTDRTAQVTDFAKGKGLYVDEKGNSWWWLRSSGTMQSYASDIDYGGDIDYYGGVVNSMNNAVRPAIWVNVDSLKELGINLDLA